MSSALLPIVHLSTPEARFPQSWMHLTVYLFLPRAQAAEWGWEIAAGSVSLPQPQGGPQEAHWCCRLSWPALTFHLC